MEGSAQQGPDLGSVVVGVDGSSTALTAAFWAAAEASRRNSSLHIFYAGDTADRISYLSAEIIERVHAEGRDLLEVTAAAVSGWVGSSPLGRTTHSLLHHSHCPVELIPRHDEEQGSDAS
ncbi:universal stress protein [Streptomyces sp. LN699]|uniref:universal stress protein n=1 Tax=Streptomyces sp. LN699 TaxID=3112981 RepID=UPI0037194D18